MHCYGAHHGGGCAFIRVAGLLTALATVNLLLHKVVASAESHQVGVVGGRGNRYGTGAAHVGVAQLVSQVLKVIGRKTTNVRKKR